MLEDDEIQPDDGATQISEAAPLGLWERIRGSFSVRERWSNLNWAISAYPKVPANYVLRGELLLRQGDTRGAIMDFQRALDLAVKALEAEDWGMVAQATQDRALAGLRDALRRAARYNSDTDQANEN